ncbi:hypothetical protein F5Y04DRAFT_292074 [Hypomontagnella monticulosa]|nr:hypothetical protein F5Y04DRAFT_292074 [Hypomontagnella monticulosa]
MDNPASNDDVQSKQACTACFESKHLGQLTDAPCGHQYCHECVESMFRLAITKESLFPPRCCNRALKVEPLEEILPYSLVLDFKKKATENGTQDRTYCHKGDCSRFLPPASYTNGYAKCNACKAETCVACKSERHAGVCPTDRGVNILIQLAKAKGWKRCWKCGAMVERVAGCRHMVCTCGARFCYQCAKERCTCLSDRAVAYPRPLPFPGERRPVA